VTGGPERPLAVGKVTGPSVCMKEQYRFVTEVSVQIFLVVSSALML
jgi:hypothetical protein